MEFDDLLDYTSRHSNLEEGQALLASLEKADLTESMNLAKGDGAVDGAFYLLYKQLVEHGLIEPIDAVSPFGEADPEYKLKESYTVLTAMPILKLIMYHCFIMGAESMKSVKDLDKLWDVEAPDNE